MKDDEEDIGWVLPVVIILCIIGWTVVILLVATART